MRVEEIGDPIWASRVANANNTLNDSAWIACARNRYWLYLCVKALGSSEWLEIAGHGWLVNTGQCCRWRWGCWKTSLVLRDDDCNAWAPMRAALKRVWCGSRALCIWSSDTIKFNLKIQAQINLYSITKSSYLLLLLAHLFCGLFGGCFKSPFQDNWRCFECFSLQYF